ncbi:hypothetical protein F511_02095 [Dorcoceras hygrometricum]|nr:hypothetical protein F511_02095 [Dorcoceras hygrometricum]
MALREVMRHRIVCSDLMLTERNLFRGRDQMSALVNGLSIDTSLEAGVAGIEERKVVVVDECLRDFGPVACLFFNSFGQAEVEVDDVTRQIGEMELVLATFQRMNPPTFTGVEAGLLVEGWLEHMKELCDAVEHLQEQRLKLAVFQLREHVQRWWNGTSRVMRETGVVISWESFCAAFRQEYTPKFFYNNREREFCWLTMADPDPAPGSDQFHEETGTRRTDEFNTDGNNSARWPEQVRRRGGGGGVRLGEEGRPKSRSRDVWIQLTVGPQPLWLRNHNFGLTHRIMLKCLATSPHDPLDSIGYPRMRASGESSTTKHRLLHASGPHPIPPPNDPKTNQYNKGLGLIHSTNGNHLESSNEGSSIDPQVTIHLHAQNITMFPINETWYFTSQMQVSSSGGLILILTAQSTRNEFRMHSDY